MLPAYSAYKGMNADLFGPATSLYIADGAIVADITYGKGAFWRQCDTARFTLLASDLLMTKSVSAQIDLLIPSKKYYLTADMRALPYRERSIDVVVLDPPYIHNPGTHMTDSRYNNAATTQGMYHRDILRELYCRGIQEARKVLRPGGLLFVKGKDEVESGQQQWSHRELYDAALRCGFAGQDLFILVASATTSLLRWERQLHARKNHSYLWVFQKDAANRAFEPRRVGRPKKSFTYTSRIKSTGGNSVAYLTARLLRDHPDVYARFQSGELCSIHAAAKAAGIIKG
jgi:hypothetical protein